MFGDKFEVFLFFFFVIDRNSLSIRSYAFSAQQNGRCDKKDSNNDTVGRYNTVGSPRHRWAFTDSPLNLQRTERQSNSVLIRI